VSKGHDLLRAAIRESGHSNVKLLKPELFNPDEIAAYKFFNKFYYETGQLPPLEAFLREGIDLPDPVQIPGQETSFLYNYRVVIERQKSNLFENLLEESKKYIRKGDVNSQKSLAEKYISECNKFDLHRSTYDSDSILDLSWQKYLKNELLKQSGNEIGVSTSWDRLDRMIHRYQPGNLYIFSGIRNLGKT
jgi:hypothetical protein